MVTCCTGSIKAREEWASKRLSEVVVSSREDRYASFHHPTHPFCSTLQMLTGVLESEERKKSDCEEGMRTMRRTINDLQYELDKAAVSRARAALQHADSLDKIAAAHDALLEVQIWHIEAESDVEGLKARNASIMQKLEDEKRTLEEANALVDEVKKHGLELRAQALPMVESTSEEWRLTIMQSCEGKTAEEIQQDREAEEAKLELIHAANPNIIKEFERRASEIARLKRKMEGSQERLQELNGHIEELMGKWEPQLDELVSKINDAFAYNFEQISCAGEVRVHKDDDFDLWAMDVMVKFRYVHL